MAHEPVSKPAVPAVAPHKKTVIHGRARSAQINLAPEVYQTSQRKKYLRRLTTSIGVGVSAVSIGLVILGAVIVGGQAVALAVLYNSIKDKQAKVETYSDLTDAVTVQQHLNSLNTLYDQRIYFSRFFEVLQTVAPQGISVTSITVNENNQLEMSATSKSYDLVTKFAKALEESNKTVGPNASPTQKAYFSDLDLASVSSDGTSGVDFKLTTRMSPEVTNGK